LAARKFDPRCDVYSLGAVLYELLTGRLPAEPKNAERLSPAAYQPWLECKRARPEAPVQAGVDSRLMAVVLKCLEFDPAARYASAAELAAELRTFLERAARPRVMRKRARRAVLAAAVAVLVLGGGAWAYVGTRPLTVEQLYRRGLAEYEQGKYDEAVETFSLCLERRSGWTEALFGRGQALLRLQKWSEARTDFTAMRDADPAWGDALAGYCSMRLREDFDAFTKFMAARREGLRDIGVLLNYARVESNRQRHAEAIKLYDEILAIDSANVLAYRNRGLAYVAIAWSDKNKTVDGKALADADECCRLEPNSIESACCAAIIYGEAARKDARFQEKAVSYLNEALRKGMPIEAANPYPPLKRILSLVDETLLPTVRHDAKYVMQFRPAHEPPSVAEWKAFQNRFGIKEGRLAQSE
jgi:tetratricopeptide (TPR) repeat protein